MIDPCANVDPSAPTPPNMSPRDAIHKAWANISNILPSTKIPTEIKREVLLPKLSATMAITKVPTKVPK